MDRMTLEMALVGYEQRKAQIEEAIREIQETLGQQSPQLMKKPMGGAGRTMSMEARKRISRAQKARWRAYRKAS